MRWDICGGQERTLTRRICCIEEKQPGKPLRKTVELVVRVGSCLECRALGCTGPRSVSTLSMLWTWVVRTGGARTMQGLCVWLQLGPCQQLVDQSPRHAFCLMDVSGCPRSGISSLGGLTHIQGAQVSLLEQTMLATSVMMTSKAQVTEICGHLVPTESTPGDDPDSSYRSRHPHRNGNLWEKPPMYRMGAGWLTSEV